MEDVPIHTKYVLSQKEASVYSNISLKLKLPTKSIEIRAYIWYNDIRCIGSFFQGKEPMMAKNKKGKELGKGICQRKDGSYMA